MKALVFLLVLANALFYAYAAGYFGHPDNPDAGRLDQQVAPEKMRLVSRGEAPSVKAPPAPPAPAVPAPEAAATAEAPAAPATAPAPGASNGSPAASAPATPAPEEKVCLRWDHLGQADANKLSARLGEKFADFKLSKRVLAGEGSSWWVHIPPLPGKDEAERKAGELRQLGVTDYFIVQEAGANHYAISLGLFSSEKGGQDRLAELKGKGVRSARLVVRPGKDSLVAVDASGPLSQKEGLLKSVHALLPAIQVADCK